MHPELQPYRNRIRQHQLAPEAEIVKSLLGQLRIDSTRRNRVSRDAAEMAQSVRLQQSSGLMSPFLVEYGLTTDEGIALMCLAEALLRVPDAETIDALISDKLVAADWGRHLGHSSSSLVNASSWALMLTGKILTDDTGHDIADTMRRVLKRLGEPVVRIAVAKAIKLIADQFILGTDIQSAEWRGREFVKRGYRYSFDMLGESALTWKDARRYRDAYVQAIKYLATQCQADDVRDNPGISVKLSAIHPRCQTRQRPLVLDDLVASTLELTRLARTANMGFNIDAEESERLDLALDVIERVLAHPELQPWDGFGIVVQAYGQRALPIIEWTYALARTTRHKVQLRLVKGAYWDTEIKRAQVLGLTDYPVFTRKRSTDLSYLACAQRLFELNDWIYPQFATHNLHTIRCVLEMASEDSEFEFQRLHGMGDEVYEQIRQKFECRCRIYAPVGAHEDLLAYLVRRILENGANSSFINQLMDERTPIHQIVSDPIKQSKRSINSIRNEAVPLPEWIYGEARRNSQGLDLESESESIQLKTALAEFAEQSWTGIPSTQDGGSPSAFETRYSPTRPDCPVGTVRHTPPEWIPHLISDAIDGFEVWRRTPADERAACLRRVADEYEKNKIELIALMVRETGKTIADALSEVREAVDFCRYYANEAGRLETMSQQSRARGVIVCISPWNFPLAIFTGQIAGALAAGNSVIAKPAEQSSLTAARALELMYQAGLPKTACTTALGLGETIGARLVADPRIAGVNFTGSVEAARSIHRTMAAQGNPLGKLVAETGGLNAMIVDSTALPEQAVRDILVSAFQSAGQRCSALRMLYIQEEMKDRVCDMLFGGMEVLTVGDPWDLATDVGPVIDAQAKRMINDHIRRMKARGLLCHQPRLANDLTGHFVAPCVFEVSGIEQLSSEVFGPVLHFASYRAQDLPDVIEAINGSGYGLTFGLHSRIDQRVQQVTAAMKIGNIYVNRNQIGAVVGCQPFGGRGLSGTGPKAGGPNYTANLRQFRNGSGTDFSLEPHPRGDVREKLAQLANLQSHWGMRDDRGPALEKAIRNFETLLPTLRETIEITCSPVDLDGPTGESNRLYFQPKGVFVCIGSSRHVIQALAGGNAVLAVGVDSRLTADLMAAELPVTVSPLLPDIESLASCPSLAGIAFEHLDRNLAAALRRDLADLDGPIVQFVSDSWAPWQFVTEKTLCIDTTAAGGNARLLIESGS